MTPPSLELSPLTFINQLGYRIRMTKLGRPKTVVRGKPSTFYLGEFERQAIAAWRMRRNLSSPSAALRDILAVVAEHEGVSRGTDVRAS